MGCEAAGTGGVSTVPSGRPGDTGETTGMLLWFSSSGAAKGDGSSATGVSGCERLSVGCVSLSDSGVDDCSGSGDLDSLSELQIPSEHTRPGAQSVS